MIRRHVRRIVLILLLVLMPSTATASWYRCAYDGVTRSACCCPTSKHKARQKAPVPSTSVRAACCCTVTEVTSAAPETRASEAMVIDSAPPVLAVEQAVTPSRGPDRIASIDRPRAQWDPPDTLFARHCSLLL
jgi:hypothetical protein